MTRRTYENLSPTLNAGAGTRLWQCGGGCSFGKTLRGARLSGTSAPRRRQSTLRRPSAGLDEFCRIANRPAVRDKFVGPLVEAVPPDEIIPQDIHAAQLARRLSAK